MEATLDTGIPRIDGRNLIVYPGLVNTHHHFFQAFVRNQLALEWSTLSLVDWLDRIYRIFSLINEDCIYHSSMVSMAELLKHGCTTAFDHQYCFNKHAGSYLIDRQFEAAERIGMRFVAGRGTNTLPRDEGSTMPEQMLESTDDYLRDCERIIREYHDGEPFAMRSVALAPCQPINCRPETFTETLSLARAHDLSMHTHLSEGENAVMLARYGKRSLDWCIDVGFCGPDVWIAHGWEMSREEMFRMAEHDIGLSHCGFPSGLGGGGSQDMVPAQCSVGMNGSVRHRQGAKCNPNLPCSVVPGHLPQCLVGGQCVDTGLTA
ncbi:MAG: amidohydrolase family protein, partial [Gammaproteobacteria bacterium]|nr:amidohydrolase family protein [Gammaproteobacteria bacterium]